MYKDRGIIIINAFSETQINSAMRLQEEFQKKDVIINVQRNNEFYSWIYKGKCFLSNFPYKFCLFYDQDFYAGKIMEKAGVLLFNNINSIEKCADKMLTHIELANNGIDMPDTIPGLWCYSRKTGYSKEQLDCIIERLGLPLVAKLCFGSSGDGVFLIKDYVELSKFCEKNTLGHFLFQKYISSSFGKDIRVFVIGQKYVGAMLRENKNDFRSNIACNGKGRACDLDDKGKCLCEKIASILNLDYCGIDLLIKENGDYLVAEVNSNAFFLEFEKITGINIAQRYVAHIINRIENINKQSKN